MLSGYRIALYSYNKEASEGFADFDYLRMCFRENENLQ